jgi:FAD/FMN-containing dehydrogenase
MPDISALSPAVSGSVLTPSDDGYAAACTGFNLAVVPRPDAVLVARDEADVVAGVRFARDAGLAIRVIATGHGAAPVPDGGLLINVAALDAVSVDSAARTATVGGGAAWAEVVAQAAPHGLAPITGSASGVGVVGFLLGGGLGPLSRHFGVGSDYLVSMRVVTGTGEVVTASADENSDLFWALRGGKGGLGVVTSATVRLVEVAELYGGALLFDATDARAVLSGWLAWGADADPRITTSVAVLRFPDVDPVPPPLRGRHLVSVRFAAPVDAASGERLAAPLRALAPVYVDALGPLPIAEIAKVHSDPEGPLPGWTRGLMLGAVDDQFVDALLDLVGAGTQAPFLGVEVRQLGGAIADPSGDSAMGGRENPYALTVIGAPNPALFATVLPAAFEGLRATLSEWVAPTTTINWLGEPEDPTEYRSAWSPAAFERLAEVRRRYDPSGVFAFGPTAA